MTAAEFIELIVISAYEFKTDLYIRALLIFLAYYSLPLWMYCILFPLVAAKLGLPGKSQCIIYVYSLRCLQGVFPLIYMEGN